MLFFLVETEEFTMINKSCSSIQRWRMFLQLLLLVMIIAHTLVKHTLNTQQMRVSNLLVNIIIGGVPAPNPRYGPCVPTPNPRGKEWFAASVLNWINVCAILGCTNVISVYLIATSVIISKTQLQD